MVSKIEVSLVPILLSHKHFDMIAEIIATFLLTMIDRNKEEICFGGFQRSTSAIDQLIV